MSNKAVRKLAEEWLSSPSTEVYGKQLIFALDEPDTVTLWDIFEKQDQIDKLRNDAEKAFLDKLKGN